MSEERKRKNEMKNAPPDGAKAFARFSTVPSPTIRTKHQLYNASNAPAVKDTVSVLYWYEELSSSKLAIFGRVLRNFFLCLCSFPPMAGGPGHWTAVQKRWEYGTQGSQVITDLSTN